MNEEDIQHLSNINGFKVGILPLKYLGVPISANKLKASDCEALVEKMVSKIRI